MECNPGSPLGNVSVNFKGSQGPIFSHQSPKIYIYIHLKIRHIGREHQPETHEQRYGLDCIKEGLACEGHMIKPGYLTNRDVNRSYNRVNKKIKWSKT